MRAISFIGRTCAGKSTAARRVASALAVPFLSVGDLIRSRATTDEVIAAAYAGKDGFSDEFIHELLSSAVGGMQDRTLVVEGSIGLGLAIERLRTGSQIAISDAVFLYCPSYVRRARFEKRQSGRSRIEALTFFDDRERLFDARLPRDLVALRGAGNLHELDGAAPIDEVCASALALLVPDEI